MEQKIAVLHRYRYSLTSKYKERIRAFLCRLIAELEERVEQVSQEISNLEGLDRKATEISDRYRPALVRLSLNCKKLI